MRMTRTRATRTTLAAAALTLMVLAGCSGSGDSKKLAAPTSTAPAGTGATGPTTTGRPVDTSFTGKDSAQFCALAKTYSDRSTKVNPASTPAQLKAVTQEGRTAIDQAAAAAPAEIKPDVQILANAFGALFTELDKVNFDASKVSAAAFSPLGTPEFQAATVRFQAYIKNVCGISS